MDHLEAEKVATIIEAYSSSQPQLTAQALHAFWLEFEPNQGIQLIKVEQRQKSEAAGIPTPVLKAIGNEIARAARKDVDDFLPLA